MPHWNCERCGGRLYSASRRLKRASCPICQGRLVPLDDEPQRFMREEAAVQETPRATRSIGGDPA